MDGLGLGRLPAADRLGERVVTDFLVDFLGDSLDVLGLGRLPVADRLGERFVTDFLVDFLGDFLPDFLMDLLDSRVFPFEADEAIYWRKSACISGQQSRD